ncbi:hypothetical protein [Nocardia sp. BMG111209]|nr:hypothetical protein [Nocardia sp. BMG111209]
MAVPMTANVVLSLAGVLGPAALILLTCVAPTRSPDGPSPDRPR